MGSQPNFDPYHNLEITNSLISNLSNWNLLRKLTNRLFNSLRTFYGHILLTKIVRIYNGVKSIFRFQIQHKIFIGIENYHTGIPCAQ